jgi:two-component system, OmpR family, sensor histidine kinase KdpD
LSSYSFFTQANLTRLREYALEEIAYRLDQRRNRSEADTAHSSAGRLMVCLSSRGPNVEHLLRKAARLADRMNVPWYAVYIQTPQEDFTRISAATQRQISNNLALVQQLGGMQMTFKGADVVATIAAFAKEYGITHILLGRTRRPWYRRWFGLSVLDRLIHALPDVDVQVAGEP